jgi:hypothetical protein
MGERLNFICLGNRLLVPHEHRPCFEAIVGHLAGLNVKLVEVMRIDGQTGMDNAQPWGTAAQLLDAPIDSDALLVAYFTVAGGRQSVTIDTRRASSVVTVSLDRQLVNPGGVHTLTMLTNLASWAAETFDAAALACGPELDLYEVNDEADVRRIEEKLASDWRCWLSMSLHHFSKRVAAVSTSAIRN